MFSIKYIGNWLFKEKAPRTTTSHQNGEASSSRMAFNKSILDAIESRELIKVKILQNCEEEKMEIMEQLSQCKEFEVVGIIGRTIILFKENKDKPVISLELKSI